MPCRNCTCSSCLTDLHTELPPLPSELLTTNRAPTDSEVVQSRSAIDSAEKRMSLLQAAMADLAEQIADVRRVIETHKGVISPLKAFPPELLVAIFMEYMNMMKYPWPGRRVVQPEPPAPLSLMWICSQWRAIILETPQFWTTISDSTPMVDLWLNRSKELPLDLCLDLPSGDVNLVLGALIPQAHRWEHVHFTLQSDSNFILSPVRDHLHSLKKLRVSCRNTTGTLDFCEEAPQLTEIQLDNVSNPPTIKLPWEQLQDCTFDGSNVALYTLQQAENIQKCHLRMGYNFDRRGMLTLSVPQVCHSRLTTLIVSRWHPGDFDVDMFFSSVTLLSLQTLELYFQVLTVRSYHLELARALFGFFKRSSLHLTALKLAGIPFSPDYLINYLALMPSLVSLNIGFAPSTLHFIDDAFFGRLNLGHDNHLLPRLKFLTLHGEVIFCKNSLDDLIASRRDLKLQDVGATLLTKLILDCTTPMDWSRCHGLPSFHRFVSEGLEITYGADWNMGPTTSQLGRV